MDAVVEHLLAILDALDPKRTFEKIVPICAALTAARSWSGRLG